MAKNNEFMQSIVAISQEDLAKKIHEEEMRLKKLEYAHAITPLENPQSIRSLRRDLARIKTVLRKKELGL